MTAVWRGAEFSAAISADARWRSHGAAFGVALTGLLLLFHRDVAALANIWWTSTTFGHCLFVLPVVGWLIWQRRVELRQVAPVGWAPGLALVAAGGFGWLLGEAASVALARQLGLLLMVWGAVAATLGPNVVRGLLFPLAWLVFLVPFGEEFEAPLQTLTAEMSVALLHLFGVPAVLDGVLITTPTGYFEVAEACSGAKFLIAMLAFATLVANVCFVSWRRRAVFMVVALTVPVFANGLRAFGTMYAAHLTSVEAATGFDHIVYGWVFFGLVMAAVLALGWRWFDRAPDDPVIDPAVLRRVWPFAADVRVATGGTIAIAAAFLAWGALIAGRADALPFSGDLPNVPGWQRVRLSETAPWAPHYPGADRYWIGRYGDGRGRFVDLAVAVYGGQHEGKELIAFGQGAIRENDSWVRIEDLPALAGGGAIRMTAPAGRGKVERTVATWYRVGDTLTASPRAAKLATVRAKLLGGRQAASALLLSAEGEQRQARGAIADFARALGPVDAAADRLTGAR
ncbi:MAG: exosortase A [Pseudomonadota bacterium]